MAATPHDLYAALALTIRDRLLKQSVRTMEGYAERDAEHQTHARGEGVAHRKGEHLPVHAGQGGGIGPALVRGDGPGDRQLRREGLGGGDRRLCR